MNHHGEIKFMVQILLIRPGTTEYDQQGRVQGTLDIPLCEDGRQEVENDGRGVARPADRGHLHQPLPGGRSKRPRPSATALDMKVKTLDKLQNLDHGLWQGMLVADVKTKQPKVYRQWQEQPETVCPPQGETLGAAEAARAGGAGQAAQEAQAGRACWPLSRPSRWRA